MEEKITDAQLKYLNILLTENIGADYRKIYLKIFYEVSSSKLLTKFQASEIISKFTDDNPNKELNKAVVLKKIYKELGQKDIFDCIVN